MFLAQVVQRGPDRADLVEELEEQALVVEVGLGVREGPGVEPIDVDFELEKLRNKDKPDLGAIEEGDSEEEEEGEEVHAQRQKQKLKYKLKIILH